MEEEKESIQSKAVHPLTAMTTDVIAKSLILFWTLLFNVLSNQSCPCCFILPLVTAEMKESTAVQSLTAVTADLTA